MNPIKQKDLTREIRENWEVIDKLESNLFKASGEWLREVCLQGHRLAQIKMELKHGDWIPWCEAHAPGRYETIKRCMRIASNWSRVTDLGEAESLRQALARCATEDNKEKMPPKRWPPAHEAILALSKFVGKIERHPLAQWNDDQKESAREMLLPVAQDLWPERLKQ